MNNEVLRKTRALSPPRNCRFNSAAATSNPQSQQMISLVCIADSPTHIHGRVGQHKRRGRLRLGSEIGSAPNRISECCVTETTMNRKWNQGAMWSASKALRWGLHCSSIHSEWLLKIELIMVTDGGLNKEWPREENRNNNLDQILQVYSFIFSLP